MSQKQTLIRRSKVNLEVPEKKERIKVWVAFFIVILALCIDGVQALLIPLGGIGVVVNSVIAGIGYFTIWIIFMILGVSILESPKKLGTMAGAGLAELIPILNALPAFSAGVIAVVLMTIAEDKGGIIGEAAGIMQGKFK